MPVRCENLKVALRTGIGMTGENRDTEGTRL